MVHVTKIFEGGISDASTVDHQKKLVYATLIIIHFAVVQIIIYIFYVSLTQNCEQLSRRTSNSTTYSLLFCM